jgi:hypothetical protein
MGTVISFPEQVHGVRIGAADDGQGEPATVIILPVVRIERYADDPAAGAESGSRSGSRSGRRRRGRGSRS